MAAVANAEGAERHPGRIQVSSSKKPIFFYVNLAKRLLALHGEIQLTALGQAISTMVSIAEILKKNGLAIERKLSTSLDARDTEDGRPKPKMEAVLVKAPNFDAVMQAEQASKTSPEEA